MAERKQNPGFAASHPTDEGLSVGAAVCVLWETLLADALDGLLKPEDQARFTAHKAACPACAALYEEARKGREWLEFLSPEPEAPAGLLEKILAKTGPGHAVEHAAGHEADSAWADRAMPVPSGTEAVPAFMPPVWQQPDFLARLYYAMQPRLLMTAAMAFFSIALTLNMTGIRLTNIHMTSLRMSDLRPSALRAYMERQLTTTSVPIVRYYDHLRLVYQVETTVRELRSQSGIEGNGSAEPEQKQTQPVTPGETRQNPEQSPGRDREQGRERKDNPAAEPAAGEANEFLESSLVLQNGSVQSGGAAMRAWERGKVWIAQIIAA